jgi:anti-anti-sigma factor
MSIPLSRRIASPLLYLDISHPSPGMARVAVSGEIDLYTADALREGLLRVLGEYTPAVLEVDLTEVEFLDCAGVDVLVDAHNAARHAGVRLRVTHPQRIVRRVLDLVGPRGVLEPVGSPANRRFSPDDSRC